MTATAAGCALAWLKMMRLLVEFSFTTANKKGSSNTAKSTCVRVVDT